MPKCLPTQLKSMVLRADVFSKDHKLAQMSAASDSLAVWFKPIERYQGEGLGVGCPCGFMYLYGYDSSEVAYHQM